MIDHETVDTGKSRFKADDADSYNAVAGHFDRYTERFSSHLTGPLLAMAGIPPNGTMLDVGTGTGVVALAAAGVMDTHGKVVGIDLSDGMLETASCNANRKGLHNQTEFLKMDAENLAFPENSFDAAISLYALHHFPNPGRAIGEIFRVLKPGASIIVAVGSPPALISTDGIKAAIRRMGSMWRKSTGRELAACEFIDKLVGKHVSPRADRDVTEWAEHHHGYIGSLRSLVRAAGFENIQRRWKGQYSIVNSVDDFWFLQMTFSSIARKRIQHADVHVAEQLKREFYRTCQRVLQKNGRLVYQSGAAIVAGVKPLLQAGN